MERGREREREGEGGTMEIELERLREALGESDAHTHIRGDRTRMREGGREGGRERDNKGQE